jgi:hypothetical protein
MITPEAQTDTRRLTAILTTDRSSRLTPSSATDHPASTGRSERTQMPTVPWGFRDPQRVAHLVDEE